MSAWDRLRNVSEARLMVVGQGLELVGSRRASIRVPIVDRSESPVVETRQKSDASNGLAAYDCSKSAAVIEATRRYR